MARRWLQSPVVRRKIGLKEIGAGLTRNHRQLGGAIITSKELKLLTYNIQAGLNCTAFKDYFKTSLSQFLPSKPNFRHLAAIGEVLKPFDVIGLQELDAGSIRSGHINQLDSLAEHSHFSFRHQQLNRNLGRLGQYSNGLLSRFIPLSVEDHRLPGLPGRGAIIADFALLDRTLTVCNVHLALSEKARNRQLSYLYRQLERRDALVLMGDMNCTIAEIQASPLGQLELLQPTLDLPSYPSWQPVRAIDHILVSANLDVVSTEVITSSLSDHCPVALTLRPK